MGIGKGSDGKLGGDGVDGVDNIINGFVDMVKESLRIFRQEKGFPGFYHSIWIDIQNPLFHYLGFVMSDGAVIGYRLTIDIGDGNLVRVN